MSRKQVLGDFTSWLCSDGKEINQNCVMHVQGSYFHQKEWCTCKVVILLIKQTVFDDLVTIACVAGGFADEGNAGQRKRAAKILLATQNRQLSRLLLPLHHECMNSLSSMSIPCLLTVVNELTILFSKLALYVPQHAMLFQARVPLALQLAA